MIDISILRELPLPEDLPNLPVCLPGYRWKYVGNGISRMRADCMVENIRTIHYDGVAGYYPWATWDALVLSPGSRPFHYCVAVPIATKLNYGHE